MAIEPQVFICYGRPDKGIAHAITVEFWRNHIECYNYLGKPTEDRFGKELPNLAYIHVSELFIAVISRESIRRFSVAEEIVHAQQWAVISESLFRVHILKDVEQPPFPKPDLAINWGGSTDPAAIVSQLLGRMGSKFVERNQKAWEINKKLYYDKWKELNAEYAGESTDA